MLQWFQRLMPRQAQFYPQFERHAAVVVSAAHALRAMLGGGDQVKLRCQEIVALEHEAERRIGRDYPGGPSTNDVW